MPRGFSDREKEKIRTSLLQECKESWTKHGYKKTSVDDLCKMVGISKGAFYLFFQSKEALFCEVLCSVQEEINDMIYEILEMNRGRQGVAEALKATYREYDNNNFLYQSDSNDFTVLMNKVSEEQAKRIVAATEKNKALFLDNPYLKFKVNPQIALSIIYSLIMTIKNKSVLPCNHLETFDFMVDHLIGDLYE